jgi:hypothetical protein
MFCASGGVFCSTGGVFVSAESRVGFTGAWSNWTIAPNTGAIAMDADKVTLVSGNSAVHDTSSVTIAVPESTSLRFSWTGTTADHSYVYDKFGYVINGTKTALAQSGKETSGTITVAVSQGDSFGFYADTADGVYGPSTTTITQFER